MTTIRPTIRGLINLINTNTSIPKQTKTELEQRVQEIIDRYGDGNINNINEPVKYIKTGYINLFDKIYQDYLNEIKYDVIQIKQDDIQTDE